MKGSYRHTQRVTPLLAVLPLGALLIGVTLAITFGEYDPTLWICFVLLGVSFWMFSSLTVQVTPAALEWHYGPGLFRWRRPLADIESVSCEPDLAHWVWRWGIRIEPYGYLYSIGGGETVRIHLKNGKQLGIRSDQADDLRLAISNAMGEQRES